MQQLTDDQLEAFDTEYVDDRRWIPIRRCIDQDFPDGRFTFLDLGGGNGLFADRLLHNYPGASGVVLDNSQLLLNRNEPHPRKRAVLASVENLESSVDTQYDVIFFNWILHHLVARSSYSGTRKNQSLALRSAWRILTDRGRVSIYEDIYNGLAIDGAPGWIVYHLTSARGVAKLLRKRGANTAGVGVCFQSYSQWCSAIARNGFRILAYSHQDLRTIPWTWRALLHVGELRCGHFWLGRQSC